MQIIKPNHRSIRDYHSALREYSEQDVSHEGAVRSAFQNLLAETAGLRKWTLIPELAYETRTPGRAIPDGTLRDEFKIPRGYWEAKDTSDDLDAEISKKIARRYPTTNTIFEDTRQAALYQNGLEVQRADLSDPQAIADLLNAFYSYEEPQIEHFEQAVEEFKDRVPHLAFGLVEKIAEAHQENTRFQEAFASFFSLCQATLNPNISQAAVDEMVVQHLLTERLFRTIFDNPDFMHNNTIATEVERVIAALTSKSFSRPEFLRSLDRFYVAIENAARGLGDYGDKQHFLNTVYERFFQGYSVKVADTHGIVYTPQPIVDFMCASVAEILEKEFGKRLGSKCVNILDPCTGTGNFVVNLLRRIPKKDLPRVYREQLFANEVMLLPYYIAAMNIEHAYYELTGEYEPFGGLCFVDTLDLAESEQREFGFMNEENTARVERQRAAPITVIIGNPPYNMGQQNENDNNKNRKYPVIDGRIRDTYAHDSKATLKTQLYDPYVKFFRWALDRLNGRDGIVCFVSNNSFVDRIAFDGMRKHLHADFSRIYHVDLHGNVRKNPKLSGTTHNVFGIQVGVGITVAVRIAQHSDRRIFYHRVPESWRKGEKYDWLDQQVKIGAVDWKEIEPDARNTWLIPENGDRFSTFLSTGSKPSKAAKDGSEKTIFKAYSGGVKTNRDSVVYSFKRDALLNQMRDFIEDYNAEVDRYKRIGEGQNVDDFVKYDRIQWDGTLKNHLRDGKYAEFASDCIRVAHYRPFAKRLLYFDRLLLNSIYLQHRFFPNPESEAANRLICVTGIGAEKPFFALTSACMPNIAFVGFGSASQCFPFYVYDEDGSNRRENVTDWALSEFRKQYKNKKITKWDIFYYVYAILHHPEYRAKYADNLKRELPRIPYAPDFAAFAAAGEALAHWHLDYEEIEPYQLKWIETPNTPLSYRVADKMRLNKEETALSVNPSLTLGGIPPEAFEYRLGNRSALEWVIDQYQVKTAHLSQITSDPNRPDDPEYIVRLVGQVIRVSLETVKIVKSLPEDFGG